MWAPGSLGFEKRFCRDPLNADIEKATQYQANTPHEPGHGVKEADDQFMC